jgi:hypothetical protein
LPPTLKPKLHEDTHVELRHNATAEAPTASDPIEPPVNHVEQWLKDLGCHQYWKGFEEDGWTDAFVVKQGLAIRHEGDALLQKLGVNKGGHRLKILLSLDLLE